MEKFDESKHPRDEEGKFTFKGGYRQNTKYSEIIENDRRREAVKKYSDDPGRDMAEMGLHKSTAIRFKRPKSHEFREMIKVAKESNPPDSRWRVDVHDAKDYVNDKLFVSEGGSCVAVEPSGNIISVCKNQSDEIRGKDLLRKAVENGGDRLDAFGEDLYDFYTRNGFEPVSWTPFNEEYAPDDWKQAKVDGYNVEPEPVIFYKYTGKQVNLSYKDFKDLVKPAADYDTAMKIRDEETKK